MPKPAVRATAEPHPVEHTIPSGDGLELILTHHVKQRSEVAEHTVLLVHGASASSYCFQIPRPHGGLIGSLLDKGADVWTLDWRGSKRVSPKYQAHPDKFTLDNAAKLDLPAAVENIRKLKPEAERLAVFGHCMGAGTLAMAIGAGYVTANDVSHVILSTLGLFYQVPWDGWVKAEDYTLERIRGDQPTVTSIDVDPERKAWPELMERVYERWPATFMPSGKNEVFRRIAFMFGQPYRPCLVSPAIHNEKQLRKQFGEIPLTLYTHCAQNVRRGFAAPFDCTDHHPAPHATYLNAAGFKDMEITLITGSRNELWHPDAMHRMYDWLQRSPEGIKCRRALFPKYAHQDLLWGKKASDEVYPTIAAGLGL
jgi:hypothetical protein